MSEKKKLIAVEGPIGVGKTTLARRLAEDFHADLMLESISDNPFLERFYSNPKSTGLATQLSFLMQRIKQLDGLQENGFEAAVCITDFLIEKDRLFAQATLDSDELSLYDCIHRRVLTAIPVPDLVIYLQAPVDVLLKRIGKRGRSFEKPVSSTYLHQLCDSYTSFFHYYDDAPLLIVNATEIDIVSHDEDYNRLVEQVRAIKSGRHFFNPLPFSKQEESA